MKEILSLMASLVKQRHVYVSGGFLSLVP